MTSSGIGVETAQRKSRLIATAPKTLVKEPLDQPRPESAAFEPSGTGARLVLANIVNGENEPGVEVLRPHFVKVVQDDLHGVRVRVRQRGNRPQICATQMAEAENP